MKKIFNLLFCVIGAGIGLYLLVMTIIVFIEMGFYTLEDIKSFSLLLLLSITLLYLSIVLAIKTIKKEVE